MRLPSLRVTFLRKADIAFCLLKPKFFLAIRCLMRYTLCKKKIL